ncbi:MAG TPA: hypothetical protein PKK48_07915 [Phycisphaerae bacterium]|nr:hypothetical protein [Phycisphaerae bacterium]HPS52381.1 hypothetical protein [Phycisphaerae bacterium]
MYRQLIESFKNDLRTNPKMVKIMAGVLCAVLVVAITVIVISAYEPAAPNPEIAKLNDVERYISSEAFLKMPVTERKEYINRVTDRIKSSNGEEEMGGFLKRLYAKNQHAGDVVQINMVSERLRPICQLDPKEQAVKINTMLNVAEMTQGYDRMYQVFNAMFGNDSPERKKKILSRSVLAMPLGMKTTTPRERKQIMQTLKITKMQMQKRYGKPLPQPQK